MAAKKEKPEQKPTLYVVFRGKDAGWYEYGRALARKGEEAIKQVAKRSTGSKGDEYASGEYKAVPSSTWESEGNNLVIVSEQKLVTSFLKVAASANGIGATKAKEPAQ